MKEIIDKINKLYNTPDGGVGGYGHIVFDDDNIETENIEWCISEAEKGEYDSYCEETRLASLDALKSILALNECDRQKAIDKACKRRQFV